MNLQEQTDIPFSNNQSGFFVDIEDRYDRMLELGREAQPLMFRPEAWNRTLGLQPGHRRRESQGAELICGDSMAEKTEKPEDQTEPAQGNEFRATLVASPEGRVFLAGIALALVYTLWLGGKILFSPDDSQILVGMTATGIIFGRAACMAFGYSLGMGHKVVIPICMIIETILVLICYPLFVFSWRRLLVIKRLRRTFDRMRKTAETHKDKVQRYGVIGLFVFVWLPFWMTGPVVGCVIGFLLGIRTWLNITVVLAGTYVAIFGWALVLRQFHDRVAAYSSHAALVMMVLLLIVIGAGHFLHRGGHDHKKQG